MYIQSGTKKRQTHRRPRKRDWVRAASILHRGGGLPLDLLETDGVLDQAGGAGQFSHSGSLQQVRREPAGQLIGAAVDRSCRIVVFFAGVIVTAT